MISFGEFLSQVFSNPALAITALLTMGVILVNGWTDAPNAIATCVTTRCLSPKLAVLMAAVFNFLGVLVMTMFNSSVAMSIYNMVDFSGNTHEATVALCAALVAIVIWASAASVFGIPTSESHALIAGLSGAAVALHGNISGINMQEWIRVIWGLVLSSALGFGLGWLSAKITELTCRNMDRQKTTKFFRVGEICASAGTAFMHGAQDGQKFMSVFLLGIALVNGQSTSEFQIPIWLMIMCSAIMCVGTSIGGYKIIKEVGQNMTKLEVYQGFASDVAAAICLFLASTTGIPVSTTHTKTTSIMGVGAAKRLSAVNWGVVKEMTWAWVLTFPGCGLVGYFMAKLFMLWF